MNNDHRFFGENGEPTPEWYDIVGKFKARAREFWDKYEKLKQIDPETLTPDLRERRKILLSRYEKIRATIENITWAIDQIIGFFGGDDSNVGNLGVIQFVPIAVISAAVATMGYIISDSVKYFKKINIYYDALDRGKSPEQAAEVAEKVDKGFLANIGSNLTTAALALAAVVIIPQFFSE